MTKQEVHTLRQAISISNQRMKLKGFRSHTLIKFSIQYWPSFFLFLNSTINNYYKRCLYFKLWFIVVDNQFGLIFCEHLPGFCLTLCDLCLFFNLPLVFAQQESSDKCRSIFYQKRIQYFLTHSFIFIKFILLTSKRQNICFFNPNKIILFKL
jgi:hypothetical protein